MVSQDHVHGLTGSCRICRDGLTGLYRICHDLYMVSQDRVGYAMISTWSHRIM